MAQEHYEAEIARLQRENEKLRTEIRQVKRDHEKSEVTWRVREAARTVGVAETALEDVVGRALNGGEWGLDTKGRLRRLVNGGPEVDISGEYVSPKTWIKSQRPHAPHWFADGSVASDDVPAAVVPNRQSLPSGTNPFVKGPNYNLTKQGEIFKKDPELAKRLAAEAGAPLDLNNAKRW